MIVKQFNSSITFSSNVYFCSQNGVNFLIDPGHYSNKMDSFISQNGGLSFILLTHGHFDHFLGIEEIIKKYPHIKIYTHYDEEQILFDSRKNGAKLFLNQDYQPSFEVEYLFEGENKINNISFELIHTPGHTPGSCCYLFKEDNILFSGDFLFANSIGRCDLPSGNSKTMNQSLLKFRNLNIDINTMIYPGHESIIKYQKMLLINPYLK